MRHPTLDSDYVSVAEYVRRKAAGAIFDKKEITPLMLADMLEKDCRQALALIKNINTANNKALLYEVADIKAWAWLGLHFAEKLKAAVALKTYKEQGGESNKQKAISYLQKALEYWDNVISITRPLYKDMPLVHLSQQGGKETKENFYFTFHWEKLRTDVERDVETARQAKTNK
jgi:hypothetical protein